MKRKIVIEIPDDKNFDWKTATENWGLFMPNCKFGHNKTPLYVWYDISTTVVSQPLDDSVIGKCNFEYEKYVEIQSVEREISLLTHKLRRLKEELNV